MEDFVRSQFWFRKRAQKYIYIAMGLVAGAAFLNTFLGNMSFNIYLVGLLAALLIIHVGWGLFVGLLVTFSGANVRAGEGQQE
jgi:ABC-type multidrug transport system fused ATPase/permease subunit